MARTWDIWIPVRPKAVQSVRGGVNGFYADHKVRRWKSEIRPYIEAACKGTEPTSKPLCISSLRYVFAYPKHVNKRMKAFIDAGGVVPYVGCADITDNLNKGLVDTCAGLVFTNDKLIWRVCDTAKVYGPKDGIHIVFEETPGITLIDGTAIGE